MLKSLIAVANIRAQSKVCGKYTQFRRFEIWSRLLSQEILWRVLCLAAVMDQNKTQKNKLRLSKLPTGLDVGPSDEAFEQRNELSNVQHAKQAKHLSKIKGLSARGVIEKKQMSARKQ